MPAQQGGFTRNLNEPGEGRDAILLSGYMMSEIDPLKRSSLVGGDLFGDNAALLANNSNAWGEIFFLDGRWHAVGGEKAQVYGDLT
jgi:DNA repair protein RadD